MANQALIKGELGVHTQPMFKGELITKPLEKAMQGFIQADQKRTAANAKRAGDIEQKYLKLLNSGSEAGVTDAVKLAGRAHIKGHADIFKNSGKAEDEMNAETEVDNTNHTYKRFLDQNTAYVELITGDKDGEIEVPEGGWYDDWATGDDLGAKYPPGVSRGSDPHAMNANLAIFGGDKDITAKYNVETGEMDFYDNSIGGTIFEHLDSEESVSQSDLNKNIFRINDKFGTMMTAEAKRQGSTNMEGKSRYVDYNKNLRTKGEIVSAYYDEMIPGVPSVYDHLHSMGKDYHVAKVGKYGSYNTKFAKEEIIKYYDQILANEQANYRAIPANVNQGKGPTETQKKKNTFFTKLKTNIAAGTPSTIWGNHQVREVEWRKDERYPKNDEFTLLYDKNTGDVIEGYNLKTHSGGRDKTMIYTDGNTYKFFNNTEEDLNFLSNKLTITQE